MTTEERVEKLFGMMLSLAQYSLDLRTLIDQTEAPHPPTSEWMKAWKESASHIDEFLKEAQEFRNG
jgi:hypothetical protein